MDEICSLRPLSPRAWGSGLVQTFIHFSDNTNPFLAEIFEEIFKGKKKGKRAQANKNTNN